MKILLFGGSGLVGSKFISLHNSAFEINAPLASEVDILDKDKLLKITEGFNPDAVINFAAYTNVEEAEKQNGDKNGISYQINATGAANIASVCRQFNKYLVHISTEYVFDGKKEESPYTELDQPNPINWYGQTKYYAEQAVLSSGCDCSIVRLSMPYSAHYELKKDVARFFLEQLKSNNNIIAIEDQRITPTLVDSIVNALKVILENKVLGIYHVSAKDSVTPLEFVKTIAETFNLSYSAVSSITLDQYNKTKTAKLLKYSWLNPAKFEKEFGDDILHSVEEDLIIFKKDVDSGDAIRYSSQGF